MKYNKIYVLAPYAHATGGVELAHQLVDYLRNQNQNAYIVYVKDRTIENSSAVTDAYKKYNISITGTIEDDERNILVLPEIYFDFIYEYFAGGCQLMADIRELIFGRDSNTKKVSLIN